MCECMHVCVCMYVCVCMCICIYVYAGSMYECMDVCMHVRVYGCVYACTCVWMCVCIYVCMYVCARICMCVWYAYRFCMYVRMYVCMCMKEDNLGTKEVPGTSVFAFVCQISRASRAKTTIKLGFMARESLFNGILDQSNDTGVPVQWHPCKGQ